MARLETLGLGSESLFFEISGRGGASGGVLVFLEMSRRLRKALLFVGLFISWEVYAVLCKIFVDNQISTVAGMEASDTFVEDCGFVGIGHSVAYLHM